MQTLKQGVIRYLTDNHLSPEQAESVFDLFSKRVSADWESVDYSPPDLARLRQQAHSVAGEWIKINLPDAWFRPIFDVG